MKAKDGSTSRPLVVMMHGTFAPSARWVDDDAPLAKAVRAVAPDVATTPLRWTGHNTFEARVDAAQKLLALLRSVGPDAPIALIAHSHGGSAICYAAKDEPDLFRNVRAIVCLATPFFGFRVRPGYRSLLSGLAIAIAFFALEFILAAFAIIGHSTIPRFDEQPAYLALFAIIVITTMLIGSRWAWARRSRVYELFARKLELAVGWDTTESVAEGWLFVRSMGDEVGLSLSMLQLLAAAANRSLNAISLVIGRLSYAVMARWNADGFGRLKVMVVLLPLAIVSAIPALMAANFGYHPRNWIDIVKPWSNTFYFSTPAFGAMDNVVRLLYAVVLLFVSLLYAIFSVFAVCSTVALAFSWATTRAFGCFSLRLAIAGEWSVEPAPEGRHMFYNAGWKRDIEDLQEEDPLALQHSEPYTDPDVVEYVSTYVAARLHPPHGSS